MKVEIKLYSTKGNLMRTLDLEIKRYEDVQALERVAWAMAESGEWESTELKHVCGNPGFGQCTGDVCPACEGRDNYKWRK